MGNLLSLYFLHPFKTRLANKTQRIYSRYGLTNPTKTPPPSFCFLPSLCYSPSSTLHTPIPLFFISHPFLPLLLPPVPLLLCLLFPCYYPPFFCYSVSYSPVTIPRSFVTLSPHPLLLPFVLMLPCLLLPCPPLLILCYYPLFLCYSVFSYPVTSYSVSPVPPPCRVKNVYLSYPQGPLLCPRQGFSSMQNMPFLPLEDALLACRTCPSWRHVFKSLIVRRLR